MHSAPPRRPSWATLVAVAVGVSCALGAGAVLVATHFRQHTSTPVAAPSTARPTTPRTSSTVTPAPTPSSTHAAAAAAAATNSIAKRRLDALVAQRSSSSTSVAVYDYTARKLVRAGTQHGMTCASIAKVQLLESLLLKHQRAGTAVTAREKASLKRMIENSDNDAADAVFADIGGRNAVLALEPRLGLNTSVHKLGASNLWGLTTTGATQEVTLVKNLFVPTSPLTKGRRAYARSLMDHVEPDQRWGVPVVGDKGTMTAVKNGWLGVASDHYRWAVNSIGFVHYHHHLLAVAVMTQHGSSYASGITRVEALVRAAVKATVS